ncbi:MAG: carboxypeptidase-like regulatory domain-containing protein [Blastocatellia bacterium]
MRSFITLLAVALLALATVSEVRAQSTFATLTGTVTDPTGASVPNATVEVKNTKTGYVYTVSSNADGVYTAPNLLEGAYQIKAKASGFGDLTINDVTLNARDNRRVDLRLQVGIVTNTVDVTAGGAALIETETARIAPVHLPDVCRGADNDCDSTRQPQGFARAVDRTIHADHRASTLGYGLPRDLHRHEHAAGHLSPRPQSTDCRQPSVQRKAAPVPELSRHHVRRQRIGASVSRLLD